MTTQKVEPKLGRFRISSSFTGVCPSVTMTSPTLPGVIPRSPDDHRYVDASELMSLTLYESIMCPRGLSSIRDFAMNSPHHFLRSTSQWTENHLVAFRCLLLENLHV